MTSQSVLTSKDIQSAFFFWSHQSRHLKTDDDLKPFLDCEKTDRGWLTRAREAQYLTTESIAQKLEISRQSYIQLEKNEKNGTITLKSLEKAAEALNCELVYAIRPKQRKLFRVLIWQKLFEQAKSHSWVKRSTQSQRARALVKIIRICESDPRFRRKQGWHLKPPKRSRFL